MVYYAADAELASVLSSYEQFIWDFDGTLARLRVDWRQLRAEISRLLRLATSPSLSVLVARARQLGREQDVFRLVADHEIRGLELVPDRVALLQQSAAASAILTNNCSATVTHFLQLAGTTTVPMMTRDMVEAPKPATEGMLKLRPLWEAKRTVVIGHSENDERVAAAVGLDCVLLESAVEE